MSDAVADEDRAGLAHEPPRPGWWPRPPDAVLRQGRLERRRIRQLQRLAESHPRLHGWLTRTERRNRRFWEGVLPRERVLPATLLVVALTVFDALATLVLVGRGTAEEGNPLLAALIERVGLAPAMGVRVLVGVGLTVVLAWLSTWRREVRPVLALVVLVLSLVAGLHVIGLVWTYG